MSFLYLALTLNTGNDILKLYTENELPNICCSKVTERQTDTQTDLSEIITYPHTRMRKMLAI